MIGNGIRTEFDLYRAMIPVRVEAKWTERTIGAIQAEHVALALVRRRRVNLALAEEAALQQRPQPRRPLAGVVLFTAAAVYTALKSWSENQERIDPSLEQKLNASIRKAINQWIHLNAWILLHYAVLLMNVERRVGLKAGSLTIDDWE